MQQKRLSLFRKNMLDSNLEAVLITNPYNRMYLSGFTGSSGFLLITLNHSLLFTDFRYRTQAPDQAVHYEIIEHGSNALKDLKGKLTELHIRELAFEEHDVTYALFMQYQQELDPIRIVPANKITEKLRMIKDEQELQIMQEAADLADQAFVHIIPFLTPGVMERDIATELEYFMRRHGAASSSFETIVASGERSALPHGKASDRILGNHEFVKLDFGAFYKGYCSDITRTVILGKASDQHRHIYNIVREAQQHALEAIRPGMTGKAADSLARDIIAFYGYGDMFGHGTGHGLGLEIHESPRLSQSDETVLEPGMTVTVEPGIYLPGFGGVRIEDDIVITTTGIRILTASTKELLELN